MLDTDIAERVLGAALANGGDYAEVFVEDRKNTSVSLSENKIEDVATGRSAGAGIRVVMGETTGFSHTADLSEEALLKAAAAASVAAQASGGGVKNAALAGESKILAHQIEIPPSQVEMSRKVDALRQANDQARSYDSKIKQVSVGYADGTRSIQVLNSDGVNVSDTQTRTRFSVQCVAQGDTGLQTGFEAPGRTVGFEFFDQFNPADIAGKAATRAVKMLEARPAPSGQIPVVLHRGAGGVLFHEACGHGLEADLVKREASVFRNRVGEKLASELVTLIDDGTMDLEWGTAAIDDEGTPTQSNTLIENGVLTDYMWDLLRSRQEGRALSGNGRRQTYQVLPMVRMTNTFLLQGNDDPEDIIAGTERGIYCVQFGGGQVDTVSGDFVFGVTEAYMIENGELTYPVRALQLIGNGLETMKRIDAVGNDFDTWTGTCGKDGQSVPVSSGQPTLRISEMTVGGTAGV